MSVQHVRAARARKEAKRLADKARKCREADHHLNDALLRAELGTRDGKTVCLACGDILFVPALDGMRQDILDRQTNNDNFIRAVIRRKPWYLKLWYRLQGFP